ncbi:site-specific recombinase, phage integrase family [gut metagenome]|uniref:Site-specific recombinase, phage integrase family n=1 Tax=gut metagenome TaxID=749906 RepID=J9D751_9ZZZZ
MEDLGNAPSTIRLKIVALRKLGEFLKIPIVLKKPKVQRTLHTENIPTEAEYYKLLEYLKSQNRLHYLYLKIIATTGARLSEFLRFKWGDILEGEVMLKGKGDKYRHFYFSPELQKEVKCYMKEQSLNTDVLVFMNRFGQPMSTRGVPELMKRWGAKCGIDKSKMHPHALRHFFAKMYLKKTKDIVQLADFLGHANIDTTRIYLQKSHEEQKRNFNRNITW